MTTWIELCAGSAAMACYFWGGKPPTSYQGSKAGYRKPIAGAFGLAPGSRPRVILAEPGPYGNVWRMLSTPGGPQAVAEVIRGWEGEEPRALWMRLRDEWRADPTLEAARYLVVAEQSYGNMGLTFAPEKAIGRKERNEIGNFGTFPLQTPARIAAAVEAVARWLLLASWSARKGDIDSGWHGEICAPGHGSITRTAERSPSSGWTIYDRAQDVPIPDDASECYVYIDPPYVGTTGYRHDLPREEVIRLALAWADRGAFVGISEQVPIEIPGWHAIRIDSERTGQKRTFSRQQAEWLTLSRPPAIRPSVQGGLFADPVVG